MAREEPPAHVSAPHGKATGAGARDPSPRRAQTEQATVERLGPWLQNIHLPSGRQTAPNHPMGDWPTALWRSFCDDLPADMRGMRVLDIGCNAGFYCIEMARRGAEVVGLEPNPRYRRQVAFATRAWGVEVTVRDGQVYELAHIDESFDVVLFLGVFYHLRYPLLALDAVARVCRGRLFFQSLMTPGEEGARPEGPLAALDAPDWPKMSFVEHELFRDPTNRWVPNPQGVEAMLRNAGFRIDARHGGHVYACSLEEVPKDWRAAEFDAATGRAWSVGPEAFEPVVGTLESRTS